MGEQLVSTIFGIDTTTALALTSSPPPVEVAVNKVLRLFLVEVTGALCIILNSLNIAVLRRAPDCFGESTTLLFTALGIVDLTTGIIIMFSEAFYVLSDIPFATPSNFCVFIYPVIVLLGILSAMFLGCLSLDKLMAITRPLRYSQIVTKFRVKCLVLAVSTFSAMNMVGYWVLIFLESPKVMYFHKESLYCRMHMYEKDSGERSKGITLLSTFGFFCMFLPLILVTYVNLRLLFIVYQHNKRQSIAPFGAVKEQRQKSITSMSNLNGSQNGTVSPTDSPVPGGKDRRTSSRVSLPLINLKALRKHRESTASATTRHRRSHYKGLRTVLVMVIAYYLAWMPMLVDVCLNIIYNTKTEASFEFVTIFMAYSNSWWNALVYLLMNRTYRRAAYKIIRCDR